MKKSLGFLLLLLSVNSFADVITMRSDLWCPYVCDPKSEKPGFIVEVAREIFKKEGHIIDYDLMNWARAVADVREGKINALVGCSKADAVGFVFPNVPIGIMVNHYYVLADSKWDYKGVDSLTSKKIGVINEYSYGHTVDEQIKKKNPALKLVS